MRLRWFLSLASVLLLVVGLTVVLHNRLDSGGNGKSSDTATIGTGGSTTSTSNPGQPADSGAVTLTGTVTTVHLEGAVLDPRTILTPLTLTSDRGMGNGAELTGVDVAGSPSVIVWDGGRPFVLASGPGVVLDPVVADLTADGLHLALGNGAHKLVPGAFQLNTPVAVGGDSTTPAEHDSVAFTAGPSALLEAKGDTALVFPHSAPPVHMKGPGLARLRGTITVTQGGHHKSVKTVDLGAGPFDLIFTPITGGWAVSGTVQPGVPNALTFGG